MDVSLLEKQFNEIGARLKLETRNTGFSIDILSDRKGEYFCLELSDRNELDVKVIDTQPQERHLLLMLRESDRHRITKHKFLCGHDERHWFVAAVPGRGTKDVNSAMEALKPPSVRYHQYRQGLKNSQLKRRRNKAYIRQGEWFFIPIEGFNPPGNLILKNEPISRGFGSKPHICEFVYRSGGETVYVCYEFPNGITQAEYNTLCNQNPKYRKRNWKVMVREPKVYAKGKISHLDHATIVLNGWHQVEMNLEFQAPSKQNVKFLD